MQSFNKNPFSGNGMNPFSNNVGNGTRIVSRYNQVSKDGGRISTEEVRKNMQQMKENDVKLTVFPTQNSFNLNQNKDFKTQQPAEANPVPANAEPRDSNSQSFIQNNFDQAQVARDRMNSFRNIGLK